MAQPAPDPGAEVPPVDEGPPPKNWAIGLYASALSVTSETRADNQAQLLGLGLHAWRRVHPRIDVGLAGARLSGETFTGANRQTTLFEVMARGHILPDGKWNPYAALGIGLTSDKVLADNGQEVASFNGTYLELGAGVEHRWNDSLSAGAELHMIKAARGGTNPSEQVPQKASGYQLRLQLTYRFPLPI